MLLPCDGFWSGPVSFWSAQNIWFWRTSFPDDELSSTNNHFSLRWLLPHDRRWPDLAAAPNFLKLFPLNNSCCLKITSHCSVPHHPKFSVSYFYLRFVERMYATEGFQGFLMPRGNQPKKESKSDLLAFDNWNVEFFFRCKQVPDETSAHFNRTSAEFTGNQFNLNSLKKNQ